MPPLPIFADWRHEIQAELAEAETALALAIDEHAAAVAEARRARMERDAVITEVNRIGAVTLSAALAIRLRQTDAPKNEADRALTRAKNAVQNAREKLADLRHAIEQLNVIAPSEPLAEGCSLAVDA